MSPLEVSPARSGAKGIREILQRQIAAAQSQLLHARAGEEGIHVVRRQLKGARATLRLLRPALGEQAYRTENTALRDAGRALRAARDSAVLVKTLEGVAAGIDDDVVRIGCARLLTRLQWDARCASAEAQRQRVHRVREQVARTQARARSLALADEGWRPVRHGLLESYRRGRKAARANRRHACCESLHEWRKRTKSLRSQVTLMAPLQNASLTRMADRLHRVANRLGEEHDLAELARLASRRRRLLGDEALARLERRIARRRSKLRKKAVTEGQRVYAEKPRHFAARVRRYVRQWTP